MNPPVILETTEIPPPKIYIYFHICCINNWKSIFNNMISIIKESGLYEKTEEIRCVVLSQNIISDMEYIKDHKIRIVEYSTNLNLYEVVTINTIFDDSLSESLNNSNNNSNKPVYVLYLHTKGVTKYNNICVNDWVKYLCYFNIHKHEKCLEKLKEGYDAVGVNLHILPQTHFSGNFWWASFEHIKTLQRCEPTNYLSPEMWVCNRTDGKYHTLCNSNVDHYHERWLEEKYIHI